jgi:SulP family sulfate permease
MAALMGLPPILGVFTSILTAPITALLGRNPVMIGGVSSVTVPFIIVAVNDQGIGGAAKVSMVAAIFMLVFSTLRLGRYVSLVPHTVMAGFSVGIGGMMVISQLHTILDYKSAADGALLGQLVEFAQHLPNPHWSTLLTAMVVMLVASACAHFTHKLPAPLIGIVAAILLASLFGWKSREVGMLPTELPPFIGFQWRPSDVYTVLPAGLGLAFVTSVNLLVTSRVVEHFRGRHKFLKKADADRELGAYGIANLAAGMFAAPMSVGIPARSLANVQCGGVSRLSNLFHAAFLIFFVTAGGEFIRHLAGVTAWMGVRLMEWSMWKRLTKMGRIDALAFLSTSIAALCLNAVFAVALGCSFYIAQYLYHTYLKTHSPSLGDSVPVSEPRP